jgi:ABC-2 type transport system permease protein
MSNLIRAELLKLRTTRMFWGNVVAALALVPVAVTLAIFNTSVHPLNSHAGVRNVMSAASSGALIFFVIGILMTAGEFRHTTATSTFLVSPNRKRVVGAKLAAASITGVIVATATSMLTLAIAVPWLAAKDIHVSSFKGDVALGVLGALAVTTLSSLVGVSVGALARNQTVAVTVALIWSQVVDGLLIGFAPGIGRWLPGGASTALTGVTTAKGGLLPMWGGALLLTAYALAFATTGTSVLARKDIA